MSGIDKLRIYLKSVRLKEVLFFSGIPLLGALFSAPLLDKAVIIRIAILIIAVILAGAHVWGWNNLCGLEADKKYDRRKDFILARQISPKGLLVLSLAPLVPVFCCFFLLPFRTVFLGILAVLFLDLYSCPGIFFKGKPVISSFVHLITGMLFFEAGYSLFKPVDVPSLLVGTYFGIVFMAGHLNHEIEDYEADLNAKIFTNAVMFGKKRMCVFSFILFTLASIYFYILGYYRILLQQLAVLPLIIYPFYFYLFFRLLKKGITSENINQFRKNYRWLYAIMGWIMVLYLLGGLSWPSMN